MKKCIHESVVNTSIGFMSIILYCIACMIYRFSYLDLLYLIVVAVCFILFLKSVKEL